MNIPIMNHDQGLYINSVFMY